MTVATLGARPPKLREAFQADGYVILRGLLDPAELASIHAEMGRLFTLQLERLGLPQDTAGSREAFRDNAVRLLQADAPTYIATARLTQMLPSANRLMISEVMTDLARALGVEFPVISTRVSNHIMSDALKIPGGYHKSPAHQDWRSIQGSLDSMVIWAPLTPTGPGAYPLEIAPGTHRLGLLPTAAHIMTPTVDDPRITEDLYQPLILSPGDVVAFSTFLVHRTGEHGDGLVRIAFSTRFNNAAEPTFVEHGFPTPYKYSYQTDLIIPDFPTKDDLRAVFPDA